MCGDFIIATLPSDNHDCYLVFYVYLLLELGKLHMEELEMSHNQSAIYENALAFLCL